MSELPIDYYDDDEYSDEPVTSDEELTPEEQDFVEQIQRDKVWATDFYYARNEEFDRMEKWYHKEHYDISAEAGEGDVVEESTDEPEHLTVVPIPTNIINSVHGILTDEDFVISAISSAGRRSEQAGNKVERLCHGTYWINRQVFGSDPWEDAALDMLILGWGCVYSYWDPYRAKLARSKASGRAKDVLDFYAYPLVVRRIHPRDIYPLPFGVRERYRGIFWMVYRTVREIEEEWSVKIMGTQLLDEDGVPLYGEDGEPLYGDLHEETEVEYIDYWAWKREEPDADGVADWCLYHCVMANNQVVKKPTKMPEYEMLPYEVFFCRKSPSDAGSKMGLSFLFPIIEPVQEMEYLANRMSALIEQFADPMLVVEGNSHPDSTIEKGPGTTIEVDNGGRAYYLTWQGSPPEVQQLIRFWREAAQDAFPPVLTGLAGGTSGLDTIALQQGGKLQTNKPRRNLELAIQRVNTKVIRLLQRFSWEDTVYVVGQRSEQDSDQSFAFSLKGRETRGFEVTSVTVRGRFPQEELRNAAIAAQLSGAGLMSRRNASSKYLYVQDAEAEFRMWMEEQMLLNPQWAQFFGQMYMGLAPTSPVSEALAESESADSMLADMSGGIAASAGDDVQPAVQRTPIESNQFSAFSGGPPRG